MSHHHHHREQEIRHEINHIRREEHLRQEERQIHHLEREIQHEIRREENREFGHHHHHSEPQVTLGEQQVIFQAVANASNNIQASYPFAHGTKVALFSLAHNHYLAGHADGKLTCHRSAIGEGASFFIEHAEGGHVYLRSEVGGFLVAHGDGSFKCNGERGHSKWHFESNSGGGLSLKAHNVSWQFGISILGNPEPIEVFTGRALWRVEAQLTDSAASGAGAAKGAFAHGTKIGLWNFAHKHYLAGHGDGSLTCHRSSAGNDETSFVIENESGGSEVYIKSAVAGYLVAFGDGSFKCNGHKGHSRWHLENTRDGGVTLKAHNVSWYLGISMFGHLECIDSHTYDRAHWRLEMSSF